MNCHRPGWASFVYAFYFGALVHPDLFLLLDYYLKNNPLPGAKLRAEINYHRHIDLAQLLEEVRREGGMLISTETETALHNVFRKIMDHVLDGDKVVLPWCQLYATMSGSFAEEEEKFDPVRHQINLQVKPRGDWKKRLHYCVPRKVEPPRPSSPRLSYIHYRHNKQTDLLLAGRVADITGNLLKIADEQDPGQGIFFEEVEHGATYRIEELYTNTSKLLRFLVPAEMPEGQYRIKVCTTVYTTSTSLRCGELGQLVKVIKPDL